MIYYIDTTKPLDMSAACNIHCDELNEDYSFSHLLDALKHIATTPATKIVIQIIEL